MPYSYSQELVHRWENWPTSLPTQWQFKEGKRAIAQAVSDNRVKARGPGHPRVNLPAQQPFWFNALRTSPPKDVSGDHGSDYPQSPCRPSRGWEHNRRWRDQRPQSPRFSSPSPDHGFESDRSSLSTTSSMSSWSDHSDGSGIPNEVDNTEKKHAWR